VWHAINANLWIVAIVVVGLFVALADVGALGPVGRAISRALADLLGIGRFALAIVLLALGVALVWGKIEFDRARASWGVVFGLVSISGIADLAGGRPGLHATSKVLGHDGGWLGVGDRWWTLKGSRGGGSGRRVARDLGDRDRRHHGRRAPSPPRGCGYVFAEVSVVC